MIGIYISSSIQSIFQSSGQMRQLTRDGKPKEHVILSPNGTQIVYNNPFDPYKSPPEPVLLNVIDIRTGKIVSRAQVKWAARFVSSIEWIIDRFVIMRGEAGFVAIVNVTSGKQTHNLFGTDFSVSPDGKKIIYHSDFNPR
ncbi:MAG: hypothetical protein L0220_35455, partial [Acidobacteria bacterium]|nr:hypothetical protein [Acidobacteriota bacterium]